MSPAAPAYEPAAYWVPIGVLRDWEQNPRVNKKAVPAVAESIRRFGFQGAIAARKDGEVMAGHTRLAAAKLLGLERVPVKFDEKLSEAEAHAYAVADNKLGEIAHWDASKLDSVLRGLHAEKVSLAGLGLSEPQLERILKQKDEGDLSRLADSKGPGLYEVVVVCKDESQQVALLDRFRKEGLQVRALVC